MKILIVEDDRKIRSFVKKGMEECGFTVQTCADGDEGLQLAVNKTYDVVILDIMLPGRDGLSILRYLREQRNSVPVILLTARSEMNERVEGLNLGADDYLTKPFFMEELIARIHAVARRASGEEISVRHLGELTLNLISRKAIMAGKSIELTSKEYNLLELLTRSPGRICSRSYILEHVWDYDFDPQTNLVDVYIRRLRNKLEQTTANAPIATVRGVGYRYAKE